MKHETDEGVVKERKKMKVSKGMEAGNGYR
jgi:hypothetical protein